MGEAPDYREDESGSIWFQDCLLVPDQKEIKDTVMKEAHESAYSIHPVSTKMYNDLRGSFWWSSMKREIVEYVSQCDVCRRVKAEHQKPAGLLQPLKVPVWKWEEIGMEFITGLPRTSFGFDSIWVIVDRLTKSAHLIPVKTVWWREAHRVIYGKNHLCTWSS